MFLGIDSNSCIRISKGIGASWDRAHLETYTKVQDLCLHFACLDLGLHCSGSYLGIDVAIKEVLPSNEYDVAKYFEREWRLLKLVALGP